MLKFVYWLKPKPLQAGFVLAREKKPASGAGFSGFYFFQRSAGIDWNALMAPSPIAAPNFLARRSATLSRRV